MALLTWPVAAGGHPCKPVPGAQAGGGKGVRKHAKEEKCVQGEILNAFQDSHTWRWLLAVSDVVAAQFFRGFLSS